MCARTRKIKTVLMAGMTGMGVMSGTAYAGGTTAGVEVENAFILNYSVSGVSQPTIDTTATGTNTPTRFTVDRLVNLTVGVVGDTAVAPGAQDQKLVFTLTNTGNDIQAYGLSIVNETGDEFSATGTTISYYVSDGDTDFEPGGDDGSPIAYSSATADLDKDLTYFVVIEGDIPAGLQDEDADNLTLLAQTLEPSTAGASAGDIVVADADNANSITGAAENVLADGQGTSHEAGNDGKHSATSAFVAASADLSAVKAVAIFAEDDTGCATISGPATGADKYSIPGACLEYTITVSNTGSTAATALTVNDILPDEIKFVAASANGFTGGSFSNPSLPATLSDCKTVSCAVNFEGASLASGSDATPTVGVITIRALIK